MAPPISNRWTTHPEYIDLLNYLIRKAKDANSPMNILPLAKEFKEKSGAAQAVSCLITRIESVRTRIHSFKHIDTNTKVKLVFALSASVDASFLKKMKKEAIVEVDNKKRITDYKSNDGTLELRGDHSLSAKIKTGKLESKGSLRSMISGYLENKNDADAIPQNEEEKEMGNLIEFISEKCVNIDTPLSIDQLAKDFKKRFGISVPLSTIRARVKGYCREIQKVEFLDTQTKVQQLFGLSATVDSDYLEKLRKDAIVKIDDKNRITYYKANDGSLVLRGDHSLSAKISTAKLESKRSFRSFITNYFETKGYTDTIPQNDEEKEMGNLIEFITEKCENVDKPINICQLARDFTKHFGISAPLDTIRTRVRGYCREIQKVEFLDTHTKIRQLFGLSAKVNSDYLEKLRKDAVVDVDGLNRITKYTANDDSMTLHGAHSQSAKQKLGWISRKKKRNAVEKHSNSGGDENEESEKEDGYSGEDSDEYSSEEFGSEFDSYDENDHLDEADHMDSSTEALGSDNETSIRNRSPIDMSIDINFDFYPLTERQHRSEETERVEDEEMDAEITGNPSVKTKSGRLSTEKHLDSEDSYNQTSSRSSEVPMSTDSSSSTLSKQKKIAIEKEQAMSSSNQSTGSSRSMRRFIRNSSIPSISTDSEEKMESEDAPRAFDCDDESLMRNESPSGVSMDDNFDFDLPTERTPQPEEIEMREDDDNDPGKTENAVVMTKSERLCKRKHLDSKFPNDLANSSSSGIPTNTNSIHSKPAKRKKMEIETSNPSSQSTRSERRSTINFPCASPQTNGNEFISVESHIRLLDSLLPMMKTMKIPTLEEDQLRIEKMIEKLASSGNEEEKIRLNEIRTSLMICLLIVEKSAKKEIVKGKDTTSLKWFLLVFYHFLIALKLKELDSFVTRVVYMLKELEVNDKKFPTKKIQLALQSIIEIIAP